MKKQFYITTLISFLIFQCSFQLQGQDKHTIDSLEYLIKTNPNDTSKINTLIHLSDNYQYNNLNKAIECVNEALKLSIKLNIQKKIALANLRLGTFYIRKMNYGAASNCTFKALQIYNNLKIELGVEGCYNCIGDLYSSEKNYDEALLYYNKALSISKQFDEKSETSLIYNNIAVIYIYLNKYTEALEIYNKALEIDELLKNDRHIASAYSNIAIVYYYMGNSSLAIEYIKKAIKIYKDIDYKPELYAQYGNLGELYLNQKKYNEAETALLTAMNNITEITDKNFIKDLFNNLSTLYEKKNNFKKAVEYARLSSAFQDSMFNEDNIRGSFELTAKYESDNKELQINNLKKDEALSEEQLKHEANFKIYLSIFGIITALFAFVIFRGNIQKRKSNKKLSLAYEQLEEKNKSITDSINYSKHIQDASLPSKELREKLFKEIFIHFKPKDIVSGDFYFFHKTDQSVFIAAADCTGHGVPGAFVSMIGSEKLEDAVSQTNNTSEILKLLNKRVKTSLHQSETNETTRDGMDIALVRIDQPGFQNLSGISTVHYSGANRPIWIIRKGQSKIEEIKATKKAIGGFTEDNQFFETHELKLQQGDTLYIFTDGYADQFGGTDGKKLMTKRFKEILVEMQNKTMQEQEKQLNTFIDNWRGNKEQVDDILVIGVRL